MAFNKEPLIQKMFEIKQIENSGHPDSAEELAQLTHSLVERSPTEEEIKGFIRNVPREQQETLVYRFQKRHEALGYLESVAQQYVAVKTKKDKFASYMDNINRPEIVNLFLRGNPEYIGIVQKPSDIQNIYKKLEDSAKKFDQLGKSLLKKIKSEEYEINKVIHHFGEYKQASHAENLVAIAIVVGFAGFVLYYLSQINPENVTVGAFFAGSNSSVLLTMLSAVVIFLLFFLTHHKLK